MLEVSSIQYRNRSQELSARLAITTSILVIMLGLITPYSSAFAYETSRTSGPHRYSTSVEISKKYWPLGSDTVVIATGSNYADALTGAPLAAKLRAPLLLTASNTLEQVTKNEIARLKAVNATILGGSGAVSLQVEEELEALGLTVTRIEGENRYETSSEIARAIDPVDTAAYVTTGSDFPDALAASAIAAVAPQTPILLVQKNVIPIETRTVLTELGINSTIVVGGAGVISETVVGQLPEAVRVAGANRYETASAMAMLGWLSGMPMETSFMVSGLNFPDAVSVGPAAGILGSPILLTDPLVLSPEPRGTLTSLFETVEMVNIIGGTGAVSDAVETQIIELNDDLSP